MATNPSPATPAAPAPTVPVVPAAPAAAVVPAAPAAPQLLTQADVELAAQAAARKAVDEERNRCNDITSLCAKAGCQAKAADFIASSKSAADVQKDLFDVLCQTNKPIGDGAGETEVTGPDAKYKAEYKANPHLVATMKLEDYIASRRIDEGHDPLMKLKSA